jgi:GT2 family glycosyltransferase
VTVGSDEQRDPRILLVIPTLGTRVDYLAQTLESVSAQSVPADVVVVVPRPATEARALASRYGARLLDDPGSLSAAVNLGLASAGDSHDYGNWIGDDDLLSPGSLAATSGALNADPRASLAFGHCCYIDADGRELWISRAGRNAIRLLAWGPDLIPQPGMLFRLAHFRTVGGLDESLEFAMDLDLLLRLRELGGFVDVRQQVSAFRWHAASLTVSDRTASLRESELVKRRYLSPRLRRIAPVWEVPVRVATRAAARRLGVKARRLSSVGSWAER